MQRSRPSELASRLTVQLACALGLCAFVAGACSESIDGSLDGLPCDRNGACVDGYVCSVDRRCVRQDRATQHGARENPSSRAGAPSAAPVRPSSRDSGDEGSAGTAGSVPAPPPESGGAEAGAGAAGAAAGAGATAGTDAGAPAVAGSGGAAVPTMCSGTLCGGDCVQLDRDPNHCGACGDPCPTPLGGVARCVDGECRPECNGGLSLCGGRCVNLEVDSSHCGTCERACISASCVAGECTMTCAPPNALCGETCADLSSHPDHCGECDSPCRGNRTCEMGECRPLRNDNGKGNGPEAGVDVAELEVLLALYGVSLEELATTVGVPVSKLSTSDIEIADLEAVGIPVAALALFGITVEMLELIGIDV